ncbi:MAG: hypothetical protein ACRCYU_09870 [Nocardioides sp.]
MSHSMVLVGRQGHGDQDVDVQEIAGHVVESSPSRNSLISSIVTTGASAGARKTGKPDSFTSNEG